MTNKTKSIIKKSTLLGVLFALIMTGYEYLTGEEFRILNFIFNFLLMGSILGISAGYTEKKKNKSKQ